MAGRDLDRGRFLLRDLVTVTLTRPASPTGPQQTATVARVQEQHDQDERVDTPMGGSLDGLRKVFHVWAAECATLVPTMEYTITTADGRVWKIEQVETLAHGRRFRCHCLQRQTTIAS